MRIESLVENLCMAVEQRDWQSVCNYGAHLYRVARNSGCHDLADAVHDAIGAALLVLEHPVFERCQASLARVVMQELERAWEGRR